MQLILIFLSFFLALSFSIALPSCSCVICFSLSNPNSILFSSARISDATETRQSKPWYLKMKYIHEYYKYERRATSASSLWHPAAIGDETASLFTALERGVQMTLQFELSEQVVPSPSTARRHRSVPVAALPLSFIETTTAHSVVTASASS